MDNEVTLDKVLERYNLSADERLDDPCIDGHLVAIATYLTAWKTVAAHLGLKAPEIEAIESDARSTEEMRQKMLQKWADKFAHEATYRSLIRAFLGINNAALATKVCQLLAPAQLTVSSGTASPSPEDAVAHNESSLHGLSSNEDHSFPSPTGTTFLPATNTSTIMLPHLETPGLSKAEKSALEGRLIRESHQILFKFNKLLKTTIKSLKDKGVTPEELVTTLMCLETIIGDQQQPLFHEHAERMVQQGSIDRIFWFLSDHISFINFDVIEHIIQSHGVDESKLRDYKVELKEYCKRRVSEHPHSNYAEPCTPGYTPVVIKLDKHINRCKILDINLFRDKLSRILQVHSHALVFLTVEEGCTQLTFRIPSFIVNLVFPLSREQEESLKAERVLKLVCDDYIYTYSNPLKRSSGNRNEPYDTTMEEGFASAEENEEDDQESHPLLGGERDQGDEDHGRHSSMPSPNIMADSEQEEPGSAFRSTQLTRPQMCHEDRYQGYKTLIQDIAERLGSDDVRSIAFNQDLPAHDNHRQPAALEVLQQLERHGLFSHFKIQPLADLLKSIHRNDLVNKHIEPYQTKYGRHSSMPESASPNIAVWSRKQPRPLSFPSRVIKSVNAIEETPGHAIQETSQVPPQASYTHTHVHMPENSLQYRPQVPIYVTEAQSRPQPQMSQQQILQFSNHSYPQSQLFERHGGSRNISTIPESTGVDHSRYSEQVSSQLQASPRTSTSILDQQYMTANHPSSENTPIRIPTNDFVPVTAFVPREFLQSQASSNSLQYRLQVPIYVEAQIRPQPQTSQQQIPQFSNYSYRHMIITNKPVEAQTFPQLDFGYNSSFSGTQEMTPDTTEQYERSTSDSMQPLRRANSYGYGTGISLSIEQQHATYWYRSPPSNEDLLHVQSEQYFQPSPGFLRSNHSRPPNPEHVPQPGYMPTIHQHILSVPSSSEGMQSQTEGHLRSLTPTLSTGKRSTSAPENYLRRSDGSINCIHHAPGFYTPQHIHRTNYSSRSSIAASDSERSTSAPENYLRRSDGSINRIHHAPGFYTPQHIHRTNYSSRSSIATSDSGPDVENLKSPSQNSAMGIQIGTVAENPPMQQPSDDQYTEVLPTYHKTLDSIMRQLQVLPLCNVTRGSGAAYNSSEDFDTDPSPLRRFRSGSPLKRFKHRRRSWGASIQDIQWPLKRNDLNKIVYEHNTEKRLKCPEKLELEYAEAKANPKLAFRLYPYGLEEDYGKNATLEIKIKIPAKKCPRLPTSAKVSLTVTAWDCKEKQCLNSVAVEKPMNLCQFTIPEFITHAALKESRSDYIEIQAFAELIKLTVEPQ